MRVPVHSKNKPVALRETRHAVRPAMTSRDKFMRYREPRSIPSHYGDCCSKPFFVTTLNVANPLPFAVAYPNAHVVGTDLSSV